MAQIEMKYLNAKYTLETEEIENLSKDLAFYDSLASIEDLDISDEEKNVLITQKQTIAYTRAYRKAFGDLQWKKLKAAITKKCGFFNSEELFEAISKASK